ncbi:hypothetical protein EJ06DRAFT_35017 [Trichodelitschia bisporula]|uniref:Uncharacterized protein n=1 Tax=Trichodelitschia bisporula TaxID=703511 RepID=A0A6G1HVE0_9PEZI|nr:hypothetical protein EJ06DRAFT_35017 [Trichodelitschia bisporula]
MSWPGRGGLKLRAAAGSPRTTRNCAVARAPLRWHEVGQPTQRMHVPGRAGGVSSSRMQPGHRGGGHIVLWCVRLSAGTEPGVRRKGHISRAGPNSDAAYCAVWCAVSRITGLWVRDVRQMDTDISADAPRTKLGLKSVNEMSRAGWVWSGTDGCAARPGTTPGHCAVGCVGSEC